jgi:hypothetical protein
MVGDLGDHGHFRAGPRQDSGVDALHIGGEEFNQPIDRRARRALEGYYNRHAGLHICPNRTIPGRRFEVLLQLLQDRIRNFKWEATPELPVSAPLFPKPQVGELRK